MLWRCVLVAFLLTLQLVSRTTNKEAEQKTWTLWKFRKCTLVLVISFWNAGTLRNESYRMLCCSRGGAFTKHMTATRANILFQFWDCEDCRRSRPLERNFLRLLGWRAWVRIAVKVKWLTGVRTAVGTGNFLFAAMFKLTLSPTNLLFDGIQGLLRLKCEADCSPQCSALVKNTWSFSSTFGHVCIAWILSRGETLFFFT